MQPNPSSRSSQRLIWLALSVSLLFTGRAVADHDPLHRSAGPFDVYIGVVPAEVVLQHAPSHPERRAHPDAKRSADRHVVVTVVQRDIGRARDDLKVSVRVMGPINAEMRRLKADPGHVDRVLRAGGERAAALADPILKQTYEIVGFLKD